jgi:hypothetical protein
MLRTTGRNGVARRQADRRPPVVDAALVEAVFGLRCRVIDDPETGTPLVVPAAVQGRAAGRDPAEVSQVETA